MDGQSALDLLASREYLPDIVLLDVMMPGMSGYEVHLQYNITSSPDSMTELRRDRCAKL